MKGPHITQQGFRCLNNLNLLRKNEFSGEWLLEIATPCFYEGFASCHETWPTDGPAMQCVAQAMACRGTGAWRRVLGCDYGGGRWCGAGIMATEVPRAPWFWGGQVEGC